MMITGRKGGVLSIVFEFNGGTSIFVTRASTGRVANIDWLSGRAHPSLSIAEQETFNN